jgi:hypothetical protein
MKAEDQKKLKIFGVLLLIAGTTWFLVYRLSPALPSTATTAQSAAAAKKAAAAIGDGRIRLDLLNDAHAYGDAGTRNLFQYRPKPAPLNPPAPPPPPPVFTPPPSTVSSGPPAPPPPPPFKRFTYETWTKTRSGKLAAVIIDEGTKNNFLATVGEVLLGQYRITRLTESSIEIEELTAPNRRQTFPKAQQ